MSRDADLLHACEERFDRLVSDGTDEDVAADRTYDALRAALGATERPFDGRDMLFANKLRTIAARAERRGL